MSRRDNDIVPILIDTKNEMKRAIDGLDQRVGELDRELRTTLRGALAELRSGPLAELKTSQREIRTSAGNAGRSAGDAAAAVAELRDDIGRLRCGFETLQSHVAELRTLLPAAVDRAAADQVAAERTVRETVGGPAGERPGAGAADGGLFHDGPSAGGAGDPRLTHLAVVPAQAEPPAEESCPAPPNGSAGTPAAQETGAPALALAAPTRSAPHPGEPADAAPSCAATDAAPVPVRETADTSAPDTGAAAAPGSAAETDASGQPTGTDHPEEGCPADGPADDRPAAAGPRAERVADGDGSEARPDGQQGERSERPCWELDGDEPRAYTPGGLQRAILRAGKVASATLVCHADTWEFVTSKTGGHPHFRTPPTTETDTGLVAAQLSGRSLVALLLTLHRVAVTPLETGCEEDLVKRSDWAMAAQLYGTTAEVLRHTLTDGTAPVVITIDNRLHNLP
ncbi:hypothetical protein [Streptomyces bohaiensis]|uniref:Uncharacterized protein n=1 Tax=Streptomyces bohaiensis TaxID=1431344 RepID=A0ABX1C8T2_9ACTN|nr:hypothetical protein [Streptomyces bohaiensis]NJQ15555.1 hypothetical protein [Streptomyces bohaiensis]